MLKPLVNAILCLFFGLIWASDSADKAHEPLNLLFIGLWGLGLFGIVFVIRLCALAADYGRTGIPLSYQTLKVWSATAAIILICTLGLGAIQCLIISPIGF